MTPSTTNTAALPLVQTTAPERIYLAVSDEEYDRDRRFLEHDEIGWSTDEPLAVCVPYVRADLATLTQQQGGEQEVGDKVTDELALIESVLLGYPKSMASNDGLRAVQVIRNALRTKQPAASEGDVAMYFADGPDGSFWAEDKKLAEAIIRKSKFQDDWTLTIATFNTSKQAAGEAVPIGWFTDDHLTDRSATTYDKTVADRWVAKGWPITPIYTTPPRHPADEALIAAYDAGFAASAEGWNAEIWPDVESRPDYYVNDRAEAIAAIQAGTP